LCKDTTIFLKEKGFREKKFFTRLAEVFCIEAPEVEKSA
jgi:hypothetical protein